MEFAGIQPPSKRLIDKMDRSHEKMLAAQAEEAPDRACPRTGEGGSTSKGKMLTYRPSVRVSNPLMSTDQAYASGDNMHGSLDMQNPMDESGDDQEPTDKKPSEADRQRERAQQYEDEYMKKYNIIHPTGEFRRKWDLVQIFLLVYIAVVVPYRIGFGIATRPWELRFCWDIVVDLYFVVDIYVNFRTAWYGSGNELIIKPRDIAKHYAKKWLPIDFASCLPIDYILLLAADGGDKETGRTNKFIRMLRLFRLLKLLRLLRLNRLLSKYKTLFPSLDFSVRTGGIAGKLLLCSHWLGCIWYHMGTDEWHMGHEYNRDGSEIRPWVERRFGGMANETDEATRYVTALYWSMMTITTVGYGDIHSQTYNEIVAGVICMIVGALVFGLVVGQMSRLTARSEPAKRDKNKRLARLSAYMAQRDVAPNMMRNIREYFRVRYEERTPFADDEYKNCFKLLPGVLRVELGRQLKYLEVRGEGGKTPGLLSKIPSLRGLDPHSTILVCSNLKTLFLDQSAMEPANVFRAGDVGHAMMIVMEGFAIHERPLNNSILDPANFKMSSGENKVKTLKVGHYVDEHMALLPTGVVGFRRDSSVWVEARCVLGFLSAEDLYSLGKQRPALSRHLIPFIAAARRARHKETIDEVFSALDADRSGWIHFPEFREAILGRRAKSEGGNAAEDFFHSLIGDAVCTDTTIRDTYNEIFLGTEDERRAKQLHQLLASSTILRNGEISIARTPSGNIGEFTGLDKESFAAWWLSSEDEEQNSFLQRRLVRARLDLVKKRVTNMESQAETIEASLAKLLRK